MLNGEGSLLDKDRILDTFYNYFAYDNIIDASDEFTRILEGKRQNVTSKFYQDYILYVFGYDAKNDTHRKSLLSTLKAPLHTSDDNKRLFVMTLMSRLIFLKFLEDKRLIRQKFLLNLLKSYQDNRIPSSFYKTYLQPVFYDVLNTPLDKREQKILEMPEFENIPYLNGGLFREIVDDELQFDIPNEIIGTIIGLLEGYHFTLKDNPDTLNPDILGLVFEKTINYLTGHGETDRRRDLGAYYTPDDVTTYISRETIQNRIFDIIRQYLQANGWRATEVDQYRSLEDFLDNPRLSPKVIRDIYERISRIAVLDPACGSGHFLTSIMKELFHIRKSMIVHINENVDNYDIKRDIVAHNLFGVDIERSAVEIAQLRLWLALIEDLDTSDHGKIDTLPNIEYNIEHGNSLLGYTSAPDATQMRMDDVENITIKRIFEEIDELKHEFRLTSDPTRAGEIKKIIETRLNLYDHKLNEALLIELVVDYNLRFSLDEIEKLNPFHWRLRFSDVFARNNGFDVIVENPPYVETGRLNYPTPSFVSSSEGSTYAFFLERSLKILCTGGYMGSIVPLATVCSKRMIPLHEFFLKNCSLIRISNYDNRPGKIFFQGLEDCRSSIIICKKKVKSDENTSIYSTKYNRWYTNERSRLLTSLNFVECTDLVSSGVIPKIGKELERDIFLKLKNKRFTISKYLLDYDSNFPVWYSRPVRYWVKASNFIPVFRGSGRKVSSNLHKLNTPNRIIQHQIIAILNSSLFYWYFIVTSYCRDLNVTDIRNFPVNLDEIEPLDSKLLVEYSAELMKDLKEHSTTGKANYKKGGIVELQEFNVKYSKEIIDKIDGVLAKHYGLTEEEKNFIIHYDERFRLQDIFRKDTKIDR